MQAWWQEVQEKGHPDKGAGPQGGWPALTDIASLAEALATIAFTGSAHHAAVNFGQVGGRTLPRAERVLHHGLGFKGPVPASCKEDVSMGIMMR